MDTINLFNFDIQALTEWFTAIGEKPFRALQVLKWLHYFGETDFEKMTNLSKALREKLMQCASMPVPEIAYHKKSADGTRKWLLRLNDGNCIEMVFIPANGRGTLCISSQVGCALNCDFCATGKQGFNRNLTTAEILGQLWLAVRELNAKSKQHNRMVTNVVFMGMGEPLLNYEGILPAIRVMLHDDLYGLAKRRVTVSTSGILPMIDQLSADTDTALAISLHAPNDELRDELVPINKKYPLQQLMKTCKAYLAKDPRRKITFEYVMLKNKNDQLTHAKELVHLLRDIKDACKINLIPFNPFPHAPYERSQREVIQTFSGVLQKAGFISTTRETRGDDIDAACGQLKGNVEDKSKRQAQWTKRIDSSIAA